MDILENSFSLLIVDDEPLFLELLQTVFSKEGYQIHTASNGVEALSLLETITVHAAIFDLYMPEIDGLSLLTTTKEKYPDIMVIMLTGRGGIEKAVEAIKHGAIDFLKKPFPTAELRVRVNQLHHIWVLKEENKNLRAKVDFTFGFKHLVGTSSAMSQLKETILQIGKSNASILIQGETGTGKELVARATHHHSLRVENPFITVDCASISENIIESELFGHVKGAFTGAYTNVQGLIRSSNGGTLFFDEIGELSPSVQAKLLRIIQEREIRPVGSTKSYPVNIRVLAATNLDLAKEVSKGRFREDLFYRLNVITIKVPPLRERKEDIALLARYFLTHLKTDFSSITQISDKAMEIMYEHTWPGNIRELQNTIMRALAMGTGKELLPGDLPFALRDKTGVSENLSQINTVNGDSLVSYEQAAIHNALTKCNGNCQEAAKILDIGIATLYRKLKLYKIKDSI